MNIKRTNCYDGMEAGILQRLAPIMAVMGVIMIVVGAALLFYYAYMVYGLLVKPEDSTFLAYILSQLPAPPSAQFTINGVMDGRSFQMSFPTDVLVYGRYVIAFVIWGIVGGAAAKLISAGVALFKGLTIKSKV